MLDSARSRTIVRMAAAAYVGYLGFKLLKNQENWESHAVVAIIFGFFFIAVALVIIFFGIKSLMGNSTVVLKEDPEEENAETTETEEDMGKTDADAEIVEENPVRALEEPAEKTEVSH